MKRVKEDFYPAPRNCLECSFSSICTTAMYMEGCCYYPPKEKLSGKIQTFLKKIFTKG